MAAPLDPRTGTPVVAMVGGTALAGIVRPAVGLLRWLSVTVLAVIAARALWSGLQPVAVRRGSGAQAVSAAQRGSGAQRVSAGRPVRALSPARAYATLAALTLVNPATLISFVALVVGLRAGSAPSALGEALFVAAAFAASASWQLLLAGSGALLGRVLTDVRGRQFTAVVSGVLIGALAVRLAVG